MPILAALAGCYAAPPPSPEPASTVTATAADPPAPIPSASQLARETPAPAVPARFTALGTEPFWAAKVDGERLIYITPEDQAGQAIPVTRRTDGAFVELKGTLAGQRLALTIFAGRCSDGMSDTVYPFAVRRRLGDDEQRGCAKPS